MNGTFREVFFMRVVGQTVEFTVQDSSQDQGQTLLDVGVDHVDRVHGSIGYLLAQPFEARLWELRFKVTNRIINFKK